RLQLITVSFHNFYHGLSISKGGSAFLRTRSAGTMPEKGATHDSSALSEALWGIFAPLAPQNRADGSSQEDSASPLPPDEGEVGQWLAQSRQILIGILFLLIATTTTLAFFDFASFKTLFSSSGRATAAWHDYQIAVALILLLVMEVIVTFV